MSATSPRKPVLVGFTVAFVVFGIFGIIWLVKKTPESPPPAAPPPVVTQATQPLTPIPPPSGRRPVPTLNIPARDPMASSNLIDLTDFYTGDLRKNWHSAGEVDNDLRELPTGLQTLAGTAFDVRGVVAVNQDSETQMPWHIDLPPIVEGIRVGQKCKQLHFLHAAYNVPHATNLQEIGQYLVHLEKGEQHVISLVIGRDLLDWHAPVPPGSPLVIAWEGENPKSRRQRLAGRGKKIHLFKSTWENPSPEVEVQTIDLVSRPGAAAPFLVAITVEPTSGLMRDPAVKRVYQQTQQWARGILDPIFKDLKLTPEQVDRATRMCADTGLKELERFATITPGTLSQPELRQIEENLLNDLYQELLPVVGENGIVRIKTLHEELPAHTTVSLLNRQLGAEQLNDEQRVHLIQIVKAEPLDLTWGMVRSDVAFWGKPEEIQEHLAKIEQSNQRILQKANSFLSPEQLSALGSVLSNAINARIAYAAAYIQKQ